MALRSSQGFGLAVVLLASIPSCAFGQAYDRIAPHQPPSAGAPSLSIPGAGPPPTGTGRAVLVPELKGLAFVSDVQSVIPAGLPAGTVGIHEQGVPRLGASDFTHVMSGFLGHPLTMDSLSAISRATTTWYRCHGRPFVYVSIPPQNVSEGVVQVVVTEYTLNHVQVSGNKWFSSGLLRRESGLRSGQTLTLDGVQSDLDWLNDNSFRTVNAVFAAGAAPGTTDVTLETEDRLPLYVYGTYDNQGVPTLGQGEWGVGAVWGNVFGTDQTLSYQFTRSDTGQYNAHSANWTIPLPWRDKILIFGSYATERPDLGVYHDGFDETGDSGQASIRYVHTLPKLSFTRQVVLTEDVQAGYDFKTTNNDLEFGGTRVFNGTAEVDQFPIIYDATEKDRFGQTVFQNELDLSPGGMTGANNNAAFQRLVAGSSASYVLDQAGLTRTTFLPGNFTWTGRVLGQVANHNLVYNEQLGLGGLYSVRGYFTDSALGSEGVLTQNEIRTPAISIAPRGLTGALHDAEQLGIFWDYGHVSQIRTIPEAVNEADLASAGINLHATLGRFVTLVFDVGWRLRNAPDYGGRGDAFGDVSLTVGY